MTKKNQNQKTLKEETEKMPLVVSELANIAVTDAESLTKVSAELILAKKELKALKEDQASLIDPLKESIANIKEKYAPRQTALESFIDSAGKQVSQYQTRLVAAQREAELAISERIKPGKGNLSIEKGIQKLEAVEKADKTLETEVGSATFVEYPMCELEDITQVPIKYYLVDMVSIRAEMKAGNKVPGIRYWTEQRLKNNRS